MEPLAMPEKSIRSLNWYVWQLHETVAYAWSTRQVPSAEPVFFDSTRIARLLRSAALHAPPPGRRFVTSYEMVTSDPYAAEMVADWAEQVAAKQACNRKPSSLYPVMETSAFKTTDDN